MTPEQKAYEKWVAVYTGDYNSAITHGYHTWEKLPEKIKETWKGVVEFIIDEWENGKARVVQCTCYLNPTGTMMYNKDCEAHGEKK